MSHDDSDDEVDYNNQLNSPSSLSAAESKRIEDERSALPATASWGKSSTPATPVIKNSSLPMERALTPDAFGPPLAVAVAQSQQQQQKQPLSPSALKRKLEKKKRKELLAKQRRAEEEQAAAVTSVAAAVESSKSPKSGKSASPKKQVEKKSEPVEVEEAVEVEEVRSVVESTLAPAQPTAVKQQQAAPEFMKYDGLVNFVLGDAFNQVCPPSAPLVDQEEGDEPPCGVSALYDSNTSSEEGNAITPLTPDLDKLTLSGGTAMSPLEFLTSNSTATTYTGTFNPFAHQLLRSVVGGGVTSPNLLNSSAAVLGLNSSSNNATQQQQHQLFDSPVRKTSRFGFAQF
jgi:hypothetical protein